MQIGIVFISSIILDPSIVSKHGFPKLQKRYSVICSLHDIRQAANLSVDLDKSLRLFLAKFVHRRALIVGLAVSTERVSDDKYTLQR